MSWQYPIHVATGQSRRLRIESWLIARLDRRGAWGHMQKVGINIAVHLLCASHVACCMILDCPDDLKWKFHKGINPVLGNHVRPLFVRAMRPMRCSVRTKHVRFPPAKKWNQGRGTLGSHVWFRCPFPQLLMRFRMRRRFMMLEG